MFFLPKLKKHVFLLLSSASSSFFLEHKSKRVQKRTPPPDRRIEAAPELRRAREDRDPRVKQAVEARGWTAEKLKRPGGSNNGTTSHMAVGQN